MAYVTQEPADLALYLDIDPDDGINDDRAKLFLTLSESLCATYVTPLPTGAETVVLPCAARGYMSPVPTQNLSLGPASVGTPPTAYGVHLSDAEIATLRRLKSGGTGGGAFSVNLLPDDYQATVPPWDTNQIVGIQP